jgi:hypothetical protein
MPNVVGTIVKLLIASLVVGIILNFMDLDALGFLRWIAHSFRDILGVFGDFFQWAMGPILVGAVLVVPIWLVFFLIGKARGR